MWVVSGFSGQVYKNGVAILMDDSKQDFKDFLIAQQNGLVEYVEATPEEIAEANKPLVQNLKLEQYQELSPTDWYYTRYIETGQEVPLEIKQQRQEIRDKYNNLIENINNDK